MKNQQPKTPNLQANNLPTVSDNEQFRSLFLHLPVPMWVYNIKSLRFLTVNNATIAQYGYSEDEFLKMTIKDIRPEEDIPALLQDVAKASTLLSMSGIRRHRKKNGTIFYADVSAHSLEYNGQSCRLVMAYDISARKRAEEDLRVKEHILSESQRIARIGSWDIDLTTGKITWTDELYRLYGVSPETFTPTQQTFLSLIHLDDRESVSKWIENLLAKKGTPELEFRVPLPDGNIRYIRGRGQAYFDKSGKPLRAMGTGQDITEQKQRDEALHQTDERLRLLSEATHDLTTVVNRDWIIEYTNTFAAQQFGVEPQQLVGRKFDELFPAEIVSRMKKNLQNVFDSGKPLYVEAPSIIQGKTLWLGSWLVPAKKTSTDEVRSILVVSRDITDRKRTEEALRENEEKYRGLVEHANDGIAIVQDGIVKFANSRLIRQRGEPLESILGSDFLTYGHPDELPKVHDLYQRRMKGENVPGTYETVLLSHDGTPINVEISASAITYRGKIADQIIARDITERKKTEEALRESESRYREVVNNATDVIFTADTEGYFRYVNPAGVKLSGFSSEELQRLRFTDLVLQEYRRQVAQKYYRQLIRRTENTYTEYPFRTKQGDIVWMAQNARLILDGEEVKGFYVISRDITERKRTEEALLKSEQRYRTLFNGMMDGVYRSTHEGRFVDVNQAMVNMFGYSNKEEMLNVDIKKELYFAEGDRESHFLDTGQEKVEIFRMRSKDGSEIWVEDHGRYVHDEDGNVIYHEGILRDVTERIKIERSLRENEERFRLMVRASNVGLWDWNLKDNSVYFSPEWKSQIGYANDELENKYEEWETRIHPEDKPIVLAKLHAALQPPHPRYEVEFRLRHKDGSYRWISVTANFIFDEHRNPVRMMGCHIDITERKTSEENMTKLNKAINSSGEIIFMTDPQGIITFVNTAFTKLYGFLPEEVVGKTTPRILNSGLSTNETYRVFWQRLLSKESIKVEFSNKTKDGRIIIVDVSVSPILDRSGNIIGFLSVQRDITERKKAEHALEDSKKQYETLVETMNEGVIQVDNENKILFVNNYLCQLLGYKREELIGNIAYELLFDDKNAKVVKEKYFLRKKGVSDTYEISMKKKSGEKLWVRISGTPLHDNGGVIVGSIAVISDMTAERTLKEQFYQAQRIESIGTLAGGIAHDFNNILSIIMGHSTLMQRMNITDSRVLQSIDAIITASQRGASLVKQMLTFSRKSETHIEPIDVNSEISELLKLLKETFTKIIEFKTDLTTNIPLIYADRTQIHQTLLNLCVNARDAITGKKQHGIISLATNMVLGADIRAKFPAAIEEQYLHISITDNGMGMSEEIKRKIFDPFFTTKEIGKGTGLGLSVAYGVIESLSGFIDVESSVGIGTTFHLYIPIKEVTAPVIELKENTLEDEPSGTETLLIAEDEDFIRELVKSILEAKGYTVLTATDGIEALDIYQTRKNEIALVVSDFGMPNMLGDQLFSQLKEINPEVLFILASGFIDPTVRVELTKRGVKEYVQKPYKPADILQKIRSVIDSRKIS
jgi:PAS domain S-box-containing protein